MNNTMTRYKITFDWWDAIIEINDDEKTKSHMKDQLLFFMNGQDLIDQGDGNITKAYLKQLTPHIIEESIRWKKGGIIDQISGDMYEGFLPIDGSFGVTLVSADHWEFPESDIEIENRSRIQQ